MRDTRDDKRLTLATLCSAEVEVEEKKYNLPRETMRRLWGGNTHCERKRKEPPTDMESKGKEGEDTGSGMR